ncbi:hypothetical protein FLK61_38940 [Paenalkalicoccus suaedae]|uniref:Uncharacterized protein n=1 Tax=Paenalkalicoccus suaedae TaxID=2592382 RepID=A0A859FJ89_9BACI|nr:hypothetical protein [Paenalkalicoccus suaedae]QKS72595.1 hypothetical protein FLK61_38940 [Paenalkalicoccus suaedae]
MSNNEYIRRSFDKNINFLKNKVAVKECFHEDINCSEKIIKAHSIQNNKILDVISDNGHVLMFSHDINEEAKLTSKMKLKGRKIATTFSGFCGHHDTSLFNPIENSDYSLGNKEQEFLFAYRAMAKEYHAKKSVGELYRYILKLIREKKFEEINQHFRGKNTPSVEQIIFMRESIYQSIKGNEDAEKRADKFREWYNEWLLLRKFENITTYTIKFEGEFHIAVSSMTNLERDLDYNLINNLNDWETMLAPIFMTVFPQNGSTYVLLSNFTRNNRRFKKLISQIENSSIEEQKVIISDIIISYMENFAYSPALWENMNDKIKKEIESKFFDTMFEINKAISKKSNINLFV